ncbi:MAG: SDR family NAD(P)-dependent oxidoreductase [Rhodospirillales bacterium]|nr:SDR family NAD(P)-dependent oxidoreductase [Rhodospirillales bacterium]
MSAYNGEYIWIVGASSGIGRALAVELAAQGAHLILSSRNEAALSALNDELGGGHQVIALDAGDHAALNAAAARLEKLDRVIFMAATYVPHEKNMKSIESVHSMLRVNLGGAFNVMHAALPLFEKQGYGQIALCGSVAGYRGLPFGQPYCAAKAGIINYAESLKIECEAKNIDVKVINPGFVRTPLTDKNDFPMPMMIEADEAARAIAKGLQGRAFEIHFPKRFTWLMKILRLLPAPLYFWIARQLSAKV